MEKYEMLRKLNINDIGDFSLKNKTTIGKVVKIYTPNTYKIILALDKVIFKFNCKLYNTKSIDTFTDNTNINKVLYFISDITKNIDDTNTDITKLLSDNTKLLKIRCCDFDTDGNLLVNLYDINQTDKKSINQQLIDEHILEHYSNNELFSFKSY
jgi:hypothetical protein